MAATTAAISSPYLANADGRYLARLVVASRSGATSELDVHFPHPTGPNGCDSCNGSSDSAPEGSGSAEDESRSGRRSGNGESEDPAPDLSFGLWPSLGGRGCRHHWRENNDTTGG
jgi:hypothetical protein